MTLKREKASAIAELHEDLAPKTTKAIWNILPHEGVFRHSQFTGHFIWSNISDPKNPNKELATLPRENWTMNPVAGDLIYSYAPPAWLGGPKGNTAHICDFLICYGPESSFRTGYEPPTVLGAIIEGLDAFAEAAKNMLVRGEDTLRIERVQGEFEAKTKRWVDWADLEKVGGKKPVSKR